MPRCAIYARYSTDQQKETSIEDQIRRSRDTASRLGLTVDETLIFADAAITATVKGIAKRTGYRRLLDAIESRTCDVVVVDEVSRLTRDVMEGGRLMQLVESIGIRFVTADGIDTDRAGWKLVWMTKLMTAMQEIDSTAHRASRGMLGQLERGFQIAQPPFGYRSHKVTTPGGRALGTNWLIDEPQAEIVKKMYQWRLAGRSAAQIAQELNTAGVLPPGSTRAKGAPYWRPASVLRVLANTIYRGVFVWNGSSFTKHKAKRRRKPVEEVSFDRPELRIVSDEVWYAANPRHGQLYSRNYAPRGGGKRLFSGLVRCGDCSALCTLGHGNGGGSLYCPQCECAHRTGGRSAWIGYSSVGAARAALREVMQRVFSQGPILEAIHQRMRQRLASGPGQEIERVRQELADVEQIVQRIKRLMITVPGGEKEFIDDLSSATARRETLKSKLRQLQEDQRRLSAHAVEAQCDVDVTSLIDELLDVEDPSTEGQGPPVFQVKATLRRLLSQFTLVSRPRKGVSVFHIGLRPGVLLAEASATETIDEEETIFRVTSATTAKRPVTWSVTCELLKQPTKAQQNEVLELAA